MIFFARDLSFQKHEPLINSKKPSLMEVDILPPPYFFSVSTLQFLFVHTKRIIRIRRFLAVPLRRFAHDRSNATFYFGAMQLSHRNRQHLVLSNEGWTMSGVGVGKSSYTYCIDDFFVYWCNMKATVHSAEVISTYQ